MMVSSRFVKAIRDAAIYNPAVQFPPACILWPDRDRQWEAVIPRLQNELPELFILGDYNPGQRTGPAIWLRCVLAGKLPEVSDQSRDGKLQADNCQLTPILYLPGVSRQDLRAVESCPDHLKPLAELQYRGVIWSQINGKDWTILAFLKSDEGGLGLDVAQDNDTRNAMQLALTRLLDEDIELLKAKRLDSNYFNMLLTGGDPVRDLLHWLDQGDAFRAGRGENEWHAFVEVCRSQLAFDPENDGILQGATKLAAHEGAWRPVWERFCEAPKRYLNIPAQIQKCPMPPLELFSNVATHGGWPQWNEAQEANLSKELLALDKLAPHDCRQRIADLETKHHDRRTLVWTELGKSPLACALEHLAILAETTASSLATGEIADLTVAYQTSGWRADDAVLQALACVERQEDWEAVTVAIRSVYLPWAEESARYLQNIVQQSGYPGGTIGDRKATPSVTGECILFVDGLRFDVARQLVELLSQRGHQIEERLCWAALPTVTGTGKPAVAPVQDRIRGQQANANFEPAVAETGQSLKGGYHFKKLLSEAGWVILEKAECGDGNGHAWCEFGNIDHEGHDRGWKLARYLDSMLSEIRERIEQLLGAGWRSIRVITDHGWLLMPGGLPKINLPSALAESKWRRCAAIKPGAVTDERLYPWFWNPELSFALADGICCYRQGDEYTHGGLSLQECLTLELIVSYGSSAEPSIWVKITDIVWKGLRCTVAVDGDFSGLSLDVRTQPGNASSSVAVSVKPLRDNGTASVVVEDEELEGSSANIVLLDPDGGLVAQVTTVIGGGSE
jgi:hypothetical protein